LELIEEQESAVRRIFEQRQSKPCGSRLYQSISVDARFERFRALQDNTVLRIRAILKDEQKKKHDPLAVRRLTSDPQQRCVEDWLKVNTPHWSPFSGTELVAQLKLPTLLQVNPGYPANQPDVLS